MYLEDFFGRIENLTEPQLEAHFSYRSGNGTNDIQIWGDADYPSLQILLKHDRAFLIFYLSEEHAGFVSTGGDEPGETEFSIGDPITVSIHPNRDVVSAGEALNAARDFLRSGERSPSLEWLEL